MTLAPKTPCRAKGCGRLVVLLGFCDAHQAQDRRAKDAQRESSTARGYGYKWQQASKGFLKSHPLCECAECGAGVLQVVAATVVDHITPHRGDMDLFWRRSNWQAMSKTCHDKKTASEDGGFGNARRVGAGKK